MLLHCAAFVYFGLIKNDLLAVTISSAVLIFLHPGFAILLAANAALLLLRRHIEAQLKGETGYPDFPEIQIIYENCRAPIEDEES